MNKLYVFISLIISVFLIQSCARKNDDSQFTGGICGVTGCTYYAYVDEDAFNNAPTDEMTLIELEIINHCLEVKFSAGGCSGDTWEIHLFDSGGIWESDPPQRNLIFSLKDEEDCEALIMKEVSFDLSMLQVENASTVKLNITNLDTSIVYEY